MADWEAVLIKMHCLPALWQLEVQKELGKG